MSLSESKCWYSNNCLHFLKRAFPLTNDPKFEGFDPAFAGMWINFGKGEKKFGIT